MSDQFFSRDFPVSHEAVGRLRCYLDDIHYHNLYQYLSSPNFYHIVPSLFRAGEGGLRAEAFSRVSHGEIQWRLAASLTGYSPCPMKSLHPHEKKLAEMLCRAGLGLIEEEWFRPDSLQLLSVDHRYLFVDAAIHHPLNRLHRVYIGPDSLLLCHYLNGLNARRWGSALDLCSGSGILGLVMSTFADKVLSTDIDPAPLRLIPLNIALNGATNITLNKEDLNRTLQGDKQYDLITCNPPFVAIPPGYTSEVYAQGTEQDGLGYLRQLFSALPKKLSPQGRALFVTDFPGGSYQPYFFAEAERFCKENRLSADAFVDSKLPGETQAPSLAQFLSAGNPNRPTQQILTDAQRFIRQDLKAAYYYLTVLVVRHASEDALPGLRVFDRYRARSFDELFV